ncbi:hypothetical protein EA472_05905 [Natrarchaeobius oligotrophus]|uniref:Uncharacterized protein n=1 Tax=Natrarchaeobius chitinivorans TaxID=1679083 RepID=A0A3N6NQ02_NATCH|nr:hypothetical protein EA472_05905 [Natrarchaeobius chitinivorans]
MVEISPERGTRRAIRTKIPAKANRHRVQRDGRPDRSSTRGRLENAPPESNATSKPNRSETPTDRSAV